MLHTKFVRGSPSDQKIKDTVPWAYLFSYLISEEIAVIRYEKVVQDKPKGIQD